MNPIFANLPTTIFEEMSGLARETGAINLGQGFPDGRGPEDVLAAAARALLEESNQYPPMAGLPALRQAVAAHYGRHQGIAVDWAGEVTVTSGATEAIASAILGVVRPGDEVVLFQPLYDAYLPLVRQAGGLPRLVTLRPPDFRIDPAELAAAMSDRTCAVIVNSPLNPSATMFGDEDLAAIAAACIRHDAIAICDEVWEHVVFDGRVHRPLMTLPGMRDRTVKIGSAGKIFALTGWKVGWTIAAPALTAGIARAHQFLTFTTPPNLQSGAAYGLAKDDAYFAGMKAELARSRDRLTAALTAEGYAVLPSAGTYFLSVDLPGSGIDLADADFARRAVREAGVASIPISALYEEDKVTSLLRLCFAKRDDVLDQAAERLGRFRRGL